MLRIKGGVDCAPTVKLSAALRDAAPLLFVPGGDRYCADLTIRARSSISGHRRSMTRDAWYDLIWTHPTIRAEGCWPDGPGPMIEHVAIDTVGQLPAPPRIPLQDRIAAAGPVRTDHLNPEAIRLAGGEDEIRRNWTAQRDADLSRDTSADAYDWPAYAPQVAGRIRALAPPKLTPTQRAHVAAARLLETRWALAGAHASVEALIRNAAAAGDVDGAEAVRALLPLIDPQLATADADI
ncbi:hypothetical protein [Micromonospora aurantiaca (nom. illeg.)]|uniref:hypothetical protein n=1 Tax=Micromonospora aurantiaca (nom. illeg.) TaxID=47850 RepID=UPI0033CE2E99